MKIFIDNSYEAMSQRAANDVAGLMQKRPQPLFCAASGDSPKGLYKQLVNKKNEHTLNISDWYFL
jgi:galactosamine-6-phosphate isomerase